MRAVLPPSRYRTRALSLARSESDLPRFEISYLVDVAFLLLTFFLLTSTLIPKEADLNLRFGIPGTITPPQAAVVPEQCLVSLDAEGKVWCDGVMVDANDGGRDLEGLRLRLAEVEAANRMIAEGAAVIVSIKADDGVKGQRFVDVMNCLAEFEIEKVKLEGFLD